MKLACIRCLLACAVLIPQAGMAAEAAKPARLPNFVIILVDDMGYGDVGCFGATRWRTPHLDRVAREGIRLTSFYVPQPVCSSSRAALLTGCYPNRIGITGALDHASRFGLSSEEKTIAEVLRPRGYTSAVFGKWHLGCQKPFLPTHHGFDEYFGLPYSNDMRPEPGRPPYPDLPIIEGDETVETNPDQSRLTAWYTERAVRFIARNRNRPFFLYLAHSMPHVPLAVSDKFKGTSGAGLYGDVIMEIDWSVGRVLAALQRHRCDENTLLIFTSDNGPWLSYGDHAGSAGPLREGKRTTYEGGVREPCIVRWPGKIPAGSVCNEPAMTIDLLPTFAHLAGAALPERKIDGLNIWPLLGGEPHARCPHEAFYFYYVRELQAVRSGPWKLTLPHKYDSLAGNPGGTDGKAVDYQRAHTDLALYNLDQDMAESKDLAKQYPDVVERLQALAEKAREELGDSAKHQEGKGVRPPGRLFEHD